MKQEEMESFCSNQNSELAKYNSSSEDLLRQRKKEDSGMISGYLQSTVSKTANKEQDESLVSEIVTESQIMVVSVNVIQNCCSLIDKNKSTLDKIDASTKNNSQKSAIGVENESSLAHGDESILFNNNTNTTPVKGKSDFHNDCNGDSNKKSDIKMSAPPKEEKTCDMGIDLSIKPQSKLCRMMDSEDKPFDSGSGLGQKESSEEGEGILTEEKLYSCNVCGVGFSRNGHLKVHMRIHTGEKPFDCDICGVLFAHNGHLKAHRMTHTGQKPYKCDVCGVGFARSGHLKSHRRMHTGEKPFTCDICGVGFSRNENLKTHRRTHTGEKPYKCDVCGAVFTENGTLKRHLRIHTGEKPYRCDICGVGFSHSGNLKSHMRVHTGEKPYKCEICTVSFSCSGHLKSHKRIHTGEKPYRCEICGVGFTQSDTLNSHKRTHTGEKSYICDLCGVGFSHTNSLKSHTKIHNKEKELQV